jgi:hypothetical protein
MNYEVLQCYRGLLDDGDDCDVNVATWQSFPNLRQLIEATRHSDRMKNKFYYKFYKN